MSAHVGRNSKIHAKPISTASAYACSPQVRIVAENRNGGHIDSSDQIHRAVLKSGFPFKMVCIQRTNDPVSGMDGSRRTNARVHKWRWILENTHTRVVRESGHTAMLRIGFRKIRCARIRFDCVLAPARVVLVRPCRLIGLMVIARPGADLCTHADPHTDTIHTHTPHKHHAHYIDGTEHGAWGLCAMPCILRAFGAYAYKPGRRNAAPDGQMYKTLATHTHGDQRWTKRHIHMYIYT